MTEKERKEAIDYINAQLEDGYIDLGQHDENEMEIIRQAMIVYDKIPDVIRELDRLKMSMDGQILKDAINY